MARLVVLAAAGTAEFVRELREAWDRGDAVLPLDPRLPPAAARQVLRVLHADEPVEPGDALVVASSGTTGEPKGVVLTHAAVAAAAWATSRRLAVDARSDRWLACLPLAHVGGLSVVTRALLTGTALDVHPGFDPDAVATAARAGATLVALVPTTLGRINPALFRAVVVGGDAAPRDRPQNVVATYGSTESGGGVVYDGQPLEGVEVRIDPGTSEIQLRGPMLLRCYRDGRDPKDENGWLGTGDLGLFDPATGRLTVHGRAGDLIISGGENVWPAPVEAVLATHPGVAEVAVVGRPDAEWGQRVTAVIVPVDPARPPSLDALRDLVKGRLGPWAAPRGLELVATLPRTALGKIRRAAVAPATGGDPPEGLSHSRG